MHRRILWNGWILASVVLVAACASSEDVSSNEGSGDDPKIEVFAEETLSWQLEIGASQTEQFQISNVGGGVLEFSIDADDADWLAINPIAGRIDGSGFVDVDISATCPDYDVDLEATIEITSNDRDSEAFLIDVQTRCGEGGEPAAQGALDIVVQGLPEGLDALITIDGPDGFSESVAESATLESLADGNYEIKAGSVGDDPHFAPQPEQQTVEIVDGDAVTATVDYVEFDAGLGSIEVEVEGLPDDVAPELTLRSGSEQWEIPADGRVDNLEPGTFELEPQPVQQGLASYEASSKSVEISSGSVTQATVVYELVTAELPVVVGGLPAGTQAAVELIGDEQTHSITESETLQDLVPGTYAVEVDDVSDSSAIYTATAPDTLDVASGQNEALTVEYEMNTGELVIEIAGDLSSGDANLDVTGPGFSDSITSNQTYSDLVPGEYEIVAHTVILNGGEYISTGAVVEVESGESTTATVTYEVVLAELPVVVSGLPSHVDADVELIGDEQTESISASTTLTDLFPGTYEVVAQTVHDGAAMYGAQSASVDVVSGENDTLEVHYQAVTTSLTIEVTGELGGNDAHVEILGPDGFNESVVESTTFDTLNPGDYEVIVHDVEDGPVTYRGSGSADLSLEGGDSETVIADYEALSSDIVVTVENYGDVDYQLSLTGPESFSEDLDGDATFAEVYPGDYTINVVNNGEDQFGNEHSIAIDPADFELQQGQTQAVHIIAAPARLVIHEDDGDGMHGSLRYVIDSVAESTVVQFDDDISEILLDHGEIDIDKAITLEATEDDPIVILGDGSRLFRVESTGALHLFDALLQEGDAQGGGAVRVEGGAQFWATRVVFEDNSSSSTGGAVLVEDDGSFHGSQVIMESNTASNGGSAVMAREDGDIFLGASLIRDNSSSTGGGAVVIDGDGVLEVEQVTFVGNESAEMGAAITVIDALARIEGSTIAQNTQSGSDGAGGIYAGSGAEVLLRGAIVADNGDHDIRGGADNFTSLGFNIIGIEAGGLEDGEHGDQVGTDGAPLDPGLEALASNGGFSETAALTEESPARAVMVGEQCFDNANLDWGTDQRGAYRPAGAYCSAGAYELDTTLETFDNAEMPTGGYNDGSFEGTSGVQWHYEDVRRSTSEQNDSVSFEGTSLILTHHDGNSSRLYTDEVTGSISSLSMRLTQAFTQSSERRVEVLINGESVGVSQDVAVEDSSETPYPIHLFVIEDFDVDGEFNLEIRPTEESAQIAIDDISVR